jgi:hypothetical protein
VRHSEMACSTSDLGQDRSSCSVRDRSAFLSIATRSRTSREVSSGPNNDLLRCKKKRAFSPSVGVGHSGYGAQFKEAELCSCHLVAGCRLAIGARRKESIGHASFGLGQGCRNGGRERQPDFHVMDLSDCIDERHPWRKTE